MDRPRKNLAGSRYRNQKKKIPLKLSVTFRRKKIKKKKSKKKIIILLSTTMGDSQKQPTLSLSKKNNENKRESTIEFLWHLICGTKDMIIDYAQEMFDLYVRRSALIERILETQVRFPSNFFFSIFHSSSSSNKITQNKKETEQEEEEKEIYQTAQASNVRVQEIRRQL